MPQPDEPYTETVARLVTQVTGHRGRLIADACIQIQAPDDITLRSPWAGLNELQAGRGPSPDRLTSPSRTH